MHSPDEYSHFMVMYIMDLEDYFLTKWSNTSVLFVEMYIL